SARPAGRVLPPASDADAPPRAASVVEAKSEAARYLEAVAASRFMHDLKERNLGFLWSGTRPASDDPAQGLATAKEGRMGCPGIRALLGTPARELVLVSPYFVPGRTGQKQLVEMARSGVKITVLTNSLEATDVVAVHAGYAKRRRALLKAGISLLEL